MLFIRERNHPLRAAPCWCFLSCFFFYSLNACFLSRSRWKHIKRFTHSVPSGSDLALMRYKPGFHTMRYAAQSVRRAIREGASTGINHTPRSKRGNNGPHSAARRIYFPLLIIKIAPGALQLLGFCHRRQCNMHEFLWVRVEISAIPALWWLCMEICLRQAQFTCWNSFIQSTMRWYDRNILSSKNFNLIGISLLVLIKFVWTWYFFFKWRHARKLANV